MKLLQIFINYVIKTSDLSEFVTRIKGIIIGKANDTFQMIREKKSFGADSEKVQGHAASLHYIF